MKLMTSDDFKLTPDRFDLSNPLNILRIWCGLCFFPAALNKLSADTEFSPFLISFFGQAGFTFPSITFWIILSIGIEVVVGFGILTGICIRWLSLLGAIELICATYALIVNNGLIWQWSDKGIEYPLFWAITSIVISIDAWKRFLNK